MMDPALTDGVLWRRFWAWLIDVAAIGVILAGLWLVLFMIGVLTLGLGFGLMALLPVVPIAYHVLFVAGSGSATPGQTLLGLVVLQDRDLSRPTLAQAIVFTAGLWLTFALGVVLLGIALFTDRNRALHDMIAGVVVVRTDALARYRRDELTARDGFANMGTGTTSA